MFRSIQLYFTEIRSGSLMFFVCLIGEPLRISVKYSFILPDDGSHTIRNMSEWSLILKVLKLFIQRRFWLLSFIQSSAFGRLIEVFDSNNAGGKPEITKVVTCLVHATCRNKLREIFQNLAVGGVRIRSGKSPTTPSALRLSILQ